MENPRRGGCPHTFPFQAPVTEPGISLGHVYRRCLFSVFWFRQRQDTGRTKPVLSDHRWSQPYSWIRAAMETRFAELTTANTEWMARSAPEITGEGRRGLSNCLLNSFQELSWNSPMFQKLEWRVYSENQSEDSLCLRKGLCPLDAFNEGQQWSWAKYWFNFRITLKDLKEV